MPTITRERKLNYDVDDEFTLPDLVDIADQVDRIIEQDRLNLLSTYYDTTRRDLSRNGITLRHRQGPDGAGWQLKLPDEGVRTEIAVADQPGSVPPALRELLDGVRRGHRLHPVAVLRINRSVQRLVDGDGSVLCTVCDDEVTADAANDGVHGEQWREVEVELGEGGDEQLLATVSRRLADAGAISTDRPSKLTRVLAAPTARTRGARTTPATAGELAGSYLSHQINVVASGDIALRAGQDVAGKVEAAVGRIRSALSVFADLWDQPRRESLDAELSWLGELLAAVREPEIVRRRVTPALRRLGSEFDVEACRRTIDARLDTRLTESNAVLQRAMHGERYRQLLADLSDWASAPPMTALADDSPESVLRRVQALERVAAKRVHRADRSSLDPAVARRAGEAAQRARYAVELARPVLAKRVSKDAIKRLSVAEQTLTDHHESDVTRQFLHDLGPTLGAGFGVGALWAMQGGGSGGQ